MNNTFEVINTFDVKVYVGTKSEKSVRLEVYDCTEHTQQTTKSFVDGVEQGHFSRYYGFRISGIDGNESSGTHQAEAFTCSSKALLAGFARVAAYGNGGFPLDQYLSQTYVGPSDSSKNGRQVL